AMIAQVSQQFTFAGAMSLSTLVLIGVGLLIACGLLLWWEMGRSRPRLAPVLWVLRVAAVAVVLWMLAGPTLLTRVRHTQTKSVVLLVDRSGSMSVPDTGGDFERDPMELRWLLSAAHACPPVTQHLDSAAAAI